MSNTSTVRPVYEKFVIDDGMDSDTAAESNFSRKMLNRSPEDSTQDIDKRSMMWKMFLILGHWEHLYP